MFVVVTTFYTLAGMKSILLPKFVFFRSRLRLSLKNTNLLFYCFYYLFYKCCTSYYNIPSSLYTREPLTQDHSTLNFYLLSAHRQSLYGTPPLWRGFRFTRNPRAFLRGDRFILSEGSAQLPHFLQLSEKSHPHVPYSGDAGGQNSETGNFMRRNTLQGSSS